MSTLVGSFRLHPVWLLVGALTAASVGLWYGSLSTLGPLVDSPMIPWLALAVAFGGVEAVVVHVHFRSEATTFSFLELPLVLGIVFAPGSQVWTAMTIGVAISLLVVRRQPPIKAAFNTANLSLQAGVAVVVMHALVPETGPLTPHGWLVAGLATTVSSWASISAIVAAIVVTEGRTDRNRIAEMLAFGSLVSLTNTTLALLAASLLDYRPASLALVIVPIIMLYAAYRSYVSERAQRERVQFLYRSTSDLRAMDKHATIPELLHNSISMFRAQSAHLFVLPSATTDAPIIRFSSGNDATAPETLDRAQSESVRSVLGGLPRPLLLTPELAEKLEPLFSCSPRTGMIGALGGDRDAVALLLVLNRLGDVTDFTHDDLGLFSTLAEQLALALVNDQLEEAVAELQQVEQELAHRASHDTLTGLADRSVLSAALDKALADGEPATVLYIDLDDFKVINDSLGHRAGDIVLVETSVRLRAEVRPSDCVARLGGDEFAIALFTAFDPEAIARRIIDSIHRPIAIAGHEVCVGASIGLARATPHQQTAELLESADTAMYAAKARGKGSVEIYRPDFRDDEPQNGRQRTSLRQALDDDEIAVAYQPIIDLATNETVGFEALARWRAPDGPLPARDFIDNAERQGLIIPIDDRVMQQAFSDLPRIVDRIPTAGFLSMNLSQRNIADATLIGRVSRRIRDSGVDPTVLVVEITEPSLHRDLSQVTAHLAALKDLGVRIALDDFGAGPGPCSITTVQELPLDILKISGSVVRNVTTDRRLLSGLVGLGRSLGLTVVAEGIESTPQRDAVRRLGCRLGQGYALGRPVMRGDLHLRLSQRGRPSFSSE
ncbi:MAG: EAL domain-containing protein [Acidimicrobiia bacterium]|nr:EAL domain-containing protein [Acidimicrobiia bacterium]